MRTFLFYLYCGWQLIINTIFKLGKMRKYTKENNEEKLDNFFVNHVYKKLVGGILKIAGVKLEVQGIENIPKKGPLVLISNHQGNFDVICLAHTLDRRVSFIAKKELEKIPLLGPWMVTMGCLFIDRSNIRQSAKVIQDAIDFIKNGNVMMIFPEGTRSKGGKMGEFKAGSFKIAIKSGAPIVPISIYGAFNVMEANKGKIKPATVKIKFHEPVSTKDLPKEEADKLHINIKEIIENGVEKLAE